MLDKFGVITIIAICFILSIILAMIFLTIDLRKQNLIMNISNDIIKQGCQLTSKTNGDYEFDCNSIIIHIKEK